MLLSPKGQRSQTAISPLDATSQTTGLSVLPVSTGLMSDRVLGDLFVETMRPVSGGRLDGVPDLQTSEEESHTLLSPFRSQVELLFESTSVFTGPGQTHYAAGSLNQPC